MPRNKTKAQANCAVQSLPQLTAFVERTLIAQALVRSGYDKSATAKRLGISRRTLYYKLKQLGLSRCPSLPEPSAP